MASADDDPNRKDPEKMSVGSVTTRSFSSSSRLSLSSTSKVSQAAAGMIKRLSLRAARSSTASVAEMVEVSAGDMCESVAAVTVRTEEGLDSPVLAELPAGTTLTVTALGAGRRIKVSFAYGQNQSMEGWVSSKTKTNEPLVTRCSPEVKLATMDLEIGGQHELKAIATVRAGEELDSEHLGELPAGSRVRIVELGARNKRRVKVATHDITGWISTATKNGEPLIGKVQDASRPSVNVQSGAKVKALLEAVRAGNLPAVVQLVEGRQSMLGRLTSRPNLNASDVRGKTALHYAAAFGHKDIIAYFLKRREVDINALDDTQKCALHHVAKRVRPVGDVVSDGVQGEITVMLIEAGAYVDARDHNGCTALMFACANGDVDVTRVLLKAQANVNIKDFDNNRPLDYALNFGQDRICEMLREEGAVRGEYVPGQQDEDEAGAEEDNREPAEATVGNEVAPDSPTSPAAEEDAAPKAEGEPAAEAAEAEAAGGGSPGSPGAKKKSVKKKSVTEVGKVDSSKPKAAAKPKAKGKAGAKAKAGGAKAKKGPTSAAMLEALAEKDDGSKEVHVQDMATEDVDLSARALGKLRAVVQSEGSPGELEAAIKVARSAGVAEGDLAEALAKLDALKLRFAAREELRRCLRQPDDVEALADAVRRAEELGVAPAELREAKKALGAQSV